MKAKIDKENVKTLYLKGYNAKEISNIFKYDIESVRKCIQRNFSKLKNVHLIAMKQRKDYLKAVNYEAKKCMTNKAFIMKNKSAYITKANGDIVLNKSVAPITTWDTPERLSKEEDLTRKSKKKN